MLDLGHIKTYVGPLWRVWSHKQVDSFWIYFVRNQFVTSCVNFLFATWMTWTGCDGERVNFLLKLIRPKSIRPNWGQFGHGQYVFMYSLDTILYHKPMKVEQNNYWLGIRATYDMLDLQTKCCPRPSASGNILSSGPTYHMLPSSPVNNCIILIYIIYMSRHLWHCVSCRERA